MKCPYQIKTIHMPEHDDGYITCYAEDITMFLECVKDECPFYYISGSGKVERCGRAVNEEKGGK